MIKIVNAFVTDCGHGYGSFEFNGDDHLKTRVYNSISRWMKVVAVDEIKTESI